MKLRIRRSAKKALLDIDDDAAFFAIVRTILDLEGNPRPRGYDRVEGRPEVYRIWIRRDWRILYSIDSAPGELVVEAVKRKGETTYRR